MTAIAIQAGFPQFADTDGTPLNNGKIYIGEVNKDPEANPIPVFFDQALSIPAALPIDTTNGYLYYQGTPASFYTGGSYSIKVVNAAGVTVYEAPEGIVTTVSNQVEEITQYLGAFATAPTTRGDGTALQVGDIFFDTTVNLMKVYDGSSFIGFAGPYLPLTGGTITGDVKFNDNEELRFGTNNDLRIYHDGSDTLIREAGVGNLKISADANVEIGSSVTAQPQVIIKGVGLNGTDFYFGNSLKASINNAGLNVDGLIEFNTLKGDSGATVNNIKDEDDMASNSPVSLATQQSIKAYVDNTVGPGETLAQTLALGNTTGGTSINVSTGDSIVLPDDAQLRFGDSGDLKIYHDSAIPGSVIRDSGAGNLIIQGTQLRVESQAGESYIEATANGGVRLYNNDVQRLTTNSSGIDVTGKVTFDQLEGQSGSAVSRVLDEDNMASNSNTALATQQSIKSYVDAQISATDSLSEVLGVGASTGGSDIDVSAGDNITFTDTSDAKFGSGDDFTIHHNGTNAILDNSTGQLLLTTETNFKLKGKSGAETLIEADSDGSVDLYYNDVKTLNTKDGGVKVTGDLEADTLSIGSFTPASIATTAPNTMTVGGTTAPLTLISTNAGVGVGPTLEFYRNSPSPAPNDNIGEIVLTTENDAGNKVDNFVRLYGKAEIITNGSETAELYLTNKQAGQDKEIFSYRHSPGVNDNDRIIFNGNGQPVDFKVQSDTDGNALFVDGTQGYVGIGTGSPSQLLDVDGTGRCNQWTVESANPYVFFKDNDSAGNEGRIGSYYTGSTQTGGISYRSQGHTNTFGAHTFFRYDGSTSVRSYELLADGSQLFCTDDGVTAHKFNAVTGNIRIGATANSSSKLDVAGETRTDHLVVDDQVRIGDGGSLDTFEADIEIRRTNNRRSNFTASCSGTTLTVESMGSTPGTIGVGELLVGNNTNIPPNTFIVSQGTGTGGVGTYTINNSLSFSSIGNLVTLSPTAHRLRFNSTDTFVEQGQPMGAIDFVSSDNQSPGVKAFIVAAHQEQFPSSYLAFGTNNSDDGTEAREVARFDERGRLLVDSRVSTSTLDHIELREGGAVRAKTITAESAEFLVQPSSVDESPLVSNRTVDEGAMLTLKQGGVDQLRVYSTTGNKPILCEPTNKGIKINPNSVQPRTSTNGVYNDAMDLGADTSQFRDLYISGGVRFGGNTDNELLDDYEKGTWTAGMTNANASPWVSPDTFTGQYTKVGRLVHVSVNMANIDTTGVNAGAIRITGLPFPILSNSGARGHSAAQLNNFTNAEAPNVYIQGIHNSSTAQLKYNRQNNSAASVNASSLDTGGTSTVIFDLTYITA